MKMFRFLKTRFEKTINRKVFIIKGFSKTEEESYMDNKYCDWYVRFFTSTAGGAYHSVEIEILEEPTYKELNKKLIAKRFDYGIIVYVGHGANQEDNQIFQLNSEQIVKVGQYLINSPKQIIILESCRVFIEAVQTVDLEDKIPAFANGGIFRIALNKYQVREIYDSHIKRCESGVMICFACGLGQSAYNYFYSKSLLQNAMDWHLDSSRHCAILPMDELTRLAFVDTIVMAQELGQLQIPVNENSTNFPIAISKF